MTWEIAVPLIVGGLSAGASVYATENAPKPPKPEKSAPAAPSDGGPGAGKKVKKYKDPAQVFKDEDLRLGQAGRLGM